MGYLYKSQCFETAAAAAQEACGQEFPRWVSNGAGGLNQVTCMPSGSDLQLTTTDSAGISATAVAPMSYASCDPLADFKDAGEMWGLLLAAILGVWLIKTFIYKLVANQ